MKTLFLFLLTIVFWPSTPAFSQEGEDVAEEASGPRSFNFDFGVPPVSRSESVDARRASLVMMAAWIHQINARPEEILRGEGAWRNYAETACLDFSNMSPTLQRWGLAELPAQPYELEDLLSLATAFGPLWVSFASHPARPVVITGLRGESGEGRALVIIHDPEVGPNREMPFAEFASGAFLSDRAVASEAAVMTVAYYPHTLANGINMHFYAGYAGGGHFNSSSRNQFQACALFVSRMQGGITYVGGRFRVGGLLSTNSVLTAAEILQHIEITCNQLSQRLGVPRKIGLLTISTHGLNQGLNLGNGNGVGSGGARYMSTAEFARQIQPFLADDAKIVLFACSTGSATNVTGSNGPPHGTYSNAIENQSGGEGCFADELRDALNQNGKRREVWGHRTTQHASSNPTWRVFSGSPNASGQRASEPDLYGDNNAPTAQLAYDIRNRIVAQLSGLVPQCGRSASERHLREFTATFMSLAPADARPFFENGTINPNLISFLEQYVVAWCAMF